MADIRTVTPDFAVAPQLLPEEVAAAAAQGFKLLINNRPDGEAEGQPTSAQMRAAAEAAGMDYSHVPVVGGPSPAQVEEVFTLVHEAKGPVLAFCRSGTRSIVAWSKGQALHNLKSREELIALGASAGYDLGPVLG
jgi:uncharacterized protein (TIGR01244 family)